MLIVAVTGGCTRNELIHLSIKDVTDDGKLVKIAIRNSKVDREFVITEGNMKSVNMLSIFRKYLSLLRLLRNVNRFFVGYHDGKCNIRPVGVNTVGAMPKQVAKYLCLQSIESYTARSFRESSIAFFADPVHP